MEPGSGSTIMGYAGITAQDIQPHSDSFFHAISIQQITDNIKAKTCPTSTSTGNCNSNGKCRFRLYNSKRNSVHVNRFMN